MSKENLNAVDYKDECHCEKCRQKTHAEGVASLLRGEQLALEPQNLERKKRHTK